jgi:hypothetical protein
MRPAARRAQKVISNDTNQPAHTPICARFQTFEWQHEVS